MTYSIIQGEVQQELLAYPDNSFDAVLTDPPYALQFMGKDWDKALPKVALWKQVFRVQKPGSYLLAFGGTRTFHRLAVSLEDAGYEIRDCLCWMYGQGMPKSLAIDKALDKKAGAKREVVGTRILQGTAALTTKERGGTHSVGISGAGRSVEVDITAPATDIAKLWAGYGTSLKPCFEPIIVARKPLDGTVANNVEKWGVGGLNIDGCRIRRDKGDKSGWSETGSQASDNTSMSGPNYARAPKPDNSGRFPPNVCLSHTEECKEIGERQVATGKAHRSKSGGNNIHSDTPKPALPDMSYGQDGKETIAAWECAEGCPVRMLDQQSGNRKSGKAVMRNGGGGKIFGKAKGKEYSPQDAGYPGETGGASRFFFCPKASVKERNRDLGVHPTVKPLALDRWLATLILPPSSGKLLVPFLGSGSELIAAAQAGWTEVVGIEREAEYVELAKARALEHLNE